jgi:lincosamide and streptogramin A transport system ATP-binding/permease protein
MLDHVTIYYGERAVCKNVSLTIEPGDRIAISGPNGSGKSSLLHLLNAEELHYTGTFQRDPQLRVSYVSQNTSHLRGTLSDYAAEHRIDESLFKAVLRKLDFARIQLEKDISAFSGGQKKKVLIARSLCEEAHLHIWDEPLNFVDVISRMQIEELLLEYTPTIVFVEHDREFHDRVATKTIELGED